MVDVTATADPLPSIIDMWFVPWSSGPEIRHIAVQPIKNLQRHSQEYLSLEMCLAIQISSS